VSALRAGTNFGALLQRVENERRSLVIEKRGTPRAILLSIRDYVRLAAPEPEVLTIIGEESKTKGTDAFNSQRIDNISGWIFSAGIELRRSADDRSARFQSCDLDVYMQLN
jgi:prevent-host-death family protein